MLRIVLIVLAFGLTPAAASELEDIIAAHVAWRGGDAFANMQSVRYAGAAAFGGLEGTISYTSRKDGYALTAYDLGAFSGATGLTPNGGWTTNTSGQVEDLGVDSLIDERRALAIEYGAPFFALANGDLSLRDSEEKGGASWSVIRVDYDNGDYADYLIDPETGALGWMRFKNDTTVFWRRLEDWRIVDGVRSSHKISDLYDAESNNVVLTWSTIEINVPLAEDSFSPPEVAARVQIAGGAATTGWIAFDFFRERRLFLDGTLNGETTTFLLDSGAEATVVDKAFADSIGLAGQGEVSATGTGGTATVQLASGVTIQIGDLTLNDLTVAILDLGAIARRAVGRDMPVILGKEVFTEAIVDIDYPKRRIAFHDPARWSYAGGGARVELNEHEGSRYVPISIGGRDPARVGFDIGQGGALSLFDAYTVREGLLDGKKTSTSRGGGVGGALIYTLARLDGVSLGGVTFDDVPTIFALGATGSFDTEREQGNLGMGVLKRFRLITDYQNDALYLEIDEMQARKPFDHNRAGVNLELGDEGVHVMHVAEGGPAAKAGLREGDIITMLDGQAAVPDYFETDQWRWIYGEPGERVRLSLASGRTIDIRLADYY